MTEQRTALVTGGSSEIGISIVQEFLNNGISVIGHYNNNQPNLSDEQLYWVKSNFESPQNVDLFLREINSITNRIDFLINSAGVIENLPLNEIKFEDVQKIYSTNVFSHFLLMQKIFLKMEENRYGRIVSLSSIGVKFAGSPTSILYSSSKSALEALTRSFAKLGADKNILCNNIRVGVIDTKIHSKKNMDNRRNLIPLKRFGTVKDISKFVLYLCLPSGDFITGQDISISGGE